MDRLEMMRYAPREFGRLPAGMLAEDYAILQALVREGLVEISSRVIMQQGSETTQDLWRKTKTPNK